MALIACSSSPPGVEEYDVSCSEASDCALVVVRGYCGFSCDHWEALSTDAAPSFEEDQRAYYDSQTCREYGLMGCSCLEDSQAPTLACEAQICVAE